MRINRLSLVSILVVGIAPIVWALANPTAENCEKKGGTLEMREITQGKYNVCAWTENGVRSECEEWAFYRGHCQISECAQWMIDEDAKKELRSYCKEPLKKMAE